MPLPDVIALDGVPRHYAWGSPTAIPRLLGIEPDGAPVAELWFGAHPDGPSPVPSHGTTLDELVAADPDAALGAAVTARFGAQLPFLVKILAAEKALSIQVHPDRAQARAGYDAENAAGLAPDAPDRNYRDPNHKPELLCALTRFEALCGFRPVPDTLRLLDAFDLDELEPVRELLTGRGGLREAFSYLLTLGEPGPLVTAVVARADALAGTQWAVMAGAVLLAAQDFPGDVGAVLTLLLNHVRLAPGEAIYLGAGNVHCYLRGTGVEIMAASDNVLRCGLTPKHVDVPEVLRVADFHELAYPRCPAEDWGFGTDFTVPVPDFAVHLVDLDAYRKPARAEGSCALGDLGKPYLLLCTDGRARVEAADGSAAELPPGHAAFVRARDRLLTVRGTGQFVAITVGS